jgi:Ca2+-binding RTX toxin-like protein
MSRKPLRKRQRLGIESLEQRRMMAGDIDFDNHTITINGDNGFDSAEVRFEGDQVHVSLLSQDLDDGDWNDRSRSEDIDEVERIVFNGFDGTDYFSVSQGLLDAGVDLSQITVEFFGGNQSDTFYNESIVASIAEGGDDVDYLHGGFGNDDLYGQAGNDFLYGREGDDYLHGGLNNDTYVFSGGNLGVDTIAEQLNQGTDKIDLRQFNPAGATSAEWLSVTLNGGAYGGYFADHLQINILHAESMENVDGSLYLRNVLFGNEQANVFVGASYNDVLAGFGGADTLWGYSGNDELWGGAGGDTLRGGSGHDLLLGDEYGSLISMAWNDMLQANGSISAEEFNDYLVSLSTADELDQLEDDEDAAGYGAVDYLFGEIGNDVLYGGSGADTLRGDRGDDWLFGGSGLDTIHGDAYSETTADGNDFLFGGSATDHLFGRGGNDHLSGGDGNDYLYGHGGDDDLFGDDGRDHLYGHAGNDLLHGGYDGDQDVLNGGADVDTFVRYRHLYQMWNGRGWVWTSYQINEELEQDFTSGEDQAQVMHV